MANERRLNYLKEKYKENYEEREEWAQAFLNMTDNNLGIRDQYTAMEQIVQREMENMGIDSTGGLPVDEQKAVLSQCIEKLSEAYEIFKTYMYRDILEGYEEWETREMLLQQGDNFPEWYLDGLNKMNPMEDIAEDGKIINNADLYATCFGTALTSIGMSQQDILDSMVSCKVRELESKLEDIEAHLKEHGVEQPLSEVTREIAKISVRLGQMEHLNPYQDMTESGEIIQHGVEYLDNFGGRLGAVLQNTEDLEKLWEASKQNFASELSKVIEFEIVRKKELLNEVNEKLDKIGATYENRYTEWIANDLGDDISRMQQMDLYNIEGHSLEGGQGRFYVADNGKVDRMENGGFNLGKSDGVYGSGENAYEVQLDMIAMNPVILAGGLAEAITFSDDNLMVLDGKGAVPVDIMEYVTQNQRTGMYHLSEYGKLQFNSDNDIGRELYLANAWHIPTQNEIKACCTLHKEDMPFSNMKQGDIYMILQTDPFKDMQDMEFMVSNTISHAGLHAGVAMQLLGDESECYPHNCQFLDAVSDMIPNDFRYLLSEAEYGYCNGHKALFSLADNGIISPEELADYYIGYLATEENRKEFAYNITCFVDSDKLEEYTENSQEFFEAMMLAFEENEIPSDYWGPLEWGSEEFEQPLTGEYYTDEEEADL